MNRLSGRRAFVQKLLLVGGGSLVLPALLNSCSRGSKPTSRIVDDSSRGHRLRDKPFPETEEVKKINTIVLGGGISGLSAARKLSELSELQFILVEMNDETGGNSSSGQNQVSAYPYGAHYLPLANIENKYLIEFLQEAGIITGFDNLGKPLYHEEYLCADPDERLYLDGLWQEGILPHVTLHESEHREITRFVGLMEHYRQLRGSDGQYAFDIPLDRSSTDSEFRDLDNISMSNWMREQGFESESIRWYINYCCRDDYGTRSDETSAWAGIHYFASRKSEAANAHFDEVLTWPEGNKFLVNKLKEKIDSDRIKTSSIVFEINSTEQGIEVSIFDLAKEKSIKYIAEHCIDCLPLFIHKRIKGNISEKVAALCGNLSYAPWMVANMTWTSAPITQNGVALSWDNVLMNDQSLGYVNACHQQLKSIPGQVVLTYYKALCSSDPGNERILASQRSADQWVEEMLQELRPVHPDIDEKLQDVEIKLWGHAMLRPTLGAIWTVRIGRNLSLSEIPNLYFAHTDHSGISIFEEAFSQGIQAAMKVISKS